MELPVGAGGGALVQCAPIVAGPACYGDDRYRVYDVVVSDAFPDLTFRTVAMLTAGQSITGPNALATPERCWSRRNGSTPAESASPSCRTPRPSTSRA